MVQGKKSPAPIITNTASRGWNLRASKSEHGAAQACKLKFEGNSSGEIIVAVHQAPSPNFANGHQQPVDCIFSCANWSFIKFLWKMLQ